MRAAAVYNAGIYGPPVPGRTTEFNRENSAEQGCFLMKVMVTAGGTTEKIDHVRSISNTSTGRLGNLIARRYAALPDVDEIYYVCGKKAVAPQSGKIKIISVGGVSDLENTVVDLLDHQKIDIIVHGMAVSDYRVKAVTSVSKVADLIAEKAEKKGAPAEPGRRNLESELCSLLVSSGAVMDRDGKIGSDIDNLLLLMERTPKIISMFKKRSPKSILVGFKLMDNVPHQILIGTAFRILTENACDFVLANDLREIDEKGHIGYLLDRSGGCVRLTTKDEIADAIVQATTKKR